jgi:hypothetical protein
MLRVVLWTKARMSHLESRRLEPREDSLQPRRRKVDESALLDRQKAVAGVQEMDGQQCRLEFFKRSQPTQTEACLSNIRTRHAFFIPS